MRTYDDFGQDDLGGGLIAMYFFIGFMATIITGHCRYLFFWLPEVIWWLLHHIVLHW